MKKHNHCWAVVQGEGQSRGSCQRISDSNPIEHVINGYFIQITKRFSHIPLLVSSKADSCGFIWRFMTEILAFNLIQWSFICGVQSIEECISCQKQCPPDRECADYAVTISSVERKQMKTVNYSSLWIIQSVIPSLHLALTCDLYLNVLSQ